MMLEKKMLTTMLIMGGDAAGDDYDGECFCAARC